MTDDIDIVIGRRVRRRRRLLGMSQEDVAAQCGVRFQQIQKYESAISRISAAMIVRLANALDVAPGYFFEGLSAPADPAGAEPAVARAGCSLAAQT